jgi:DNA-binding transcriptional ArsR family regulator
MRMTKLPTFEEQTISEVTAMFKVLADPNRLRIFDLLMHGDSCNCELNDQLGLPANLLSHHLHALKKAGLIDSRRDALDGRWIYYAVKREAVAHWQSWLNQFFDPTRIQTRQTLCGPEGQQIGEKMCRSETVGV